MIINPKPLACMIIFSFVIILATCYKAHEPFTLAGLIFWISFSVFAFSCTHLSKNENYYKNYFDDDL